MATEPRLEVIRRLAEYLGLGARAEGAVHLRVHQVEVEVQARVQVVVQPGEQVVIVLLIEQVPIERDDPIACVDECEADLSWQAPRQAVEERERQELEAMLRTEGDRLVKPME